MFNKISPESAGISSKSVLEYFDYLNRRGITMHGALLMKGEDIFAECYWSPFNKDFCHRMYSQTKSYVAIAIGLLQDEGKLKITDKIAPYFAEIINPPLPEYLKEQTIEDMLLMETAGASDYWFNSPVNSRLDIYFNHNHNERPSRTIWQYDSPGSQVMCALVERLTGKTMLEYLKEKLFDKMDTFKTAQLLKVRDGYSWGDSALVCTQRDMASFARLLLNGGKWNGKQLISENFVKKATSPIVNNDESGFYDCFHSHGYGYQIWHTEMGGFAFVGMGGQITIAVPSLDAIFVCTGDNQGYPSAYNLIIDGLFDFVFRKMGSPIPKSEQAENALENFCSSQKLISLANPVKTDFESTINGVTFFAPENKTGITQFAFKFEGEKGIFCYENAQGYKEIPFGLGYNEFSLFPELGYSDNFGGERSNNGFKYKCACSGGWVEEKKLCIKVQVIDRYFGNFFATFAWKDGYCAVKFKKTAEDFFQTYDGSFVAVGQHRQASIAK